MFYANANFSFLNGQITKKKAQTIINIQTVFELTHIVIFEFQFRLERSKHVESERARETLQHSTIARNRRQIYCFAVFRVDHGIAWQSTSSLKTSTEF